MNCKYCQVTAHVVAAWDAGEMDADVPGQNVFEASQNTVESWEKVSCHIVLAVKDHAFSDMFHKFLLQNKEKCVRMLDKGEISIVESKKKTPVFAAFTVDEPVWFPPQLDCLPLNRIFMRVFETGVLTTQHYLPLT